MGGVVVEAPLVCRRDEKGEGGEFSLQNWERWWLGALSDGSFSPMVEQRPPAWVALHWLLCARRLC